ncbi:unnamed protein product, partial [Choristocarpus tenellus]
MSGEWCQLWLSQHLPVGAYIDVDEARHDYDILQSHPKHPGVVVHTWEDFPIDVELPASTSGQHVVGFQFWSPLLCTDKGGGELKTAENGTGQGGTGSGCRNEVLAQLTLPLHLRYPDPGCPKGSRECKRHVFVEVPPPLISIRCGSENVSRPVVLVSPPETVLLEVPRGLIWHRDIVVWGTLLSSIVGTIMLLRVILRV